MKSNLSVNTKFVFGFSIDPTNDGSKNYAASYFENVVAIWDSRMFERPVYQINEQDSILKMAWCPTK